MQITSCKYYKLHQHITFSTQIAFCWAFNRSNLPRVYYHVWIPLGNVTPFQRFNNLYIFIRKFAEKTLISDSERFFSFSSTFWNSFTRERNHRLTVKFANDFKFNFFYSIANPVSFSNQFVKALCIYVIQLSRLCRICCIDRIIVNWSRWQFADCDNMRECNWKYCVLNVFIWNINLWRFIAQK